MDLSGLPDDTLNPGLDLGGLPDTNAKALREQYRATTSTPDDAAKVIDITKRTGLPKPVVERNRQEAERKALEPDWGDLETSAPITVREMAANVKLFELANDDTENLRNFERTLNRRSEGRIGGPAFDRTRGEVKPIIAPAAGFSSVVAGQLGVLPNTFERIRQGLRLEIADLFGLDTVRDDALRQRERTDFRESISTPYFDSTLGRWVYGGAANVQRVVPLIAAGIATRSPAVGLAAMGAQVQPETYGKYRGRGGTPGEAALGSGVETAIEIGTEMLPMGFVVDKFGKAGATQFLAGYLGRELPTELAAEVAQGAVDTAIANPNKTWGEYVAELPDTVGQTVTSTLMMSGGLTAANEAARRLAGPQAQADTATQDAEALAQLSQLAAASKLRARDPQTFQEFVAAANEDGPVQDIYLDARTLQQAGIDPALLARASPAVAAQIEQALATGGDLVIPMAEYAARIAGTDLDPVLTPHLRTSEEGLSLDEAQRFYQGQAEEFQKVAAQVMEEKVADDAWTASAKAVEVKLFDELKNAGRFTDDVNTAYATLMRDFYVATASRLGITPEEMFARYPLRVAAERMAGGAASRMSQEDVNAAERAGFDSSQVWLHGTTAARDFKSFKLGDGELGPGVYLTKTPMYANAWARGENARIMQLFIKKGDVFDLTRLKIDPNQRIAGDQQRVDTAYSEIANRVLAAGALPTTLQGMNAEDLTQRIKETSKQREALNKWLDMAGYVGAKDHTSQIRDQVVIFRPESIRSISAKFNPKKADSKNILAQAAQSVMQALGIQTQQAEPVEQVDTGGPALDMGQFFQGDKPDLIVQHNLSADNLLHAVKMGGIPVPSLAITKAENPLTGFGEITLLGSKDMADPKGYAGTKVFGADIYSPRYPSVVYKLDSKALKKLNAALAPFRKEGAREIYSGEISKVEDLTQVDAFRAYMLDKTGKTDIWDLRSGDMEAEASKMLAEAGADEKLFKGYDYNGNRRYQPHTLENVVKILKKELRGGENFNYGVGSIRAKFTPQFRSLEQIRKAKNRLMDKDGFEAVKSEIDNEFNSLSESLAPYHSYGEKFGFGDVMTQMMYDAASMGVSRSLRENQFTEVPAEQQQETAEFLTKLRDLPTEYFEAKILRDVDLTEFSGAVVPEGVNPKVVEALQARGVKDIRYYKKGDDADRRAKIGEFENLFFQGNRAEIAFGRDITQQPSVITLFANADLSSALHELGHFQLEVLAHIAGQPNAPAEIAADMARVLEWFGITGTEEVGGGETAGSLGQDSAALARARAQGFDVDSPAYHWSPLTKGDFPGFAPFQHFGTAQAAYDRYIQPLGMGASVGDLDARKANPPPEGATFKVVINKTNVFDLGEDTGSHDPYQLAKAIGEKNGDEWLANDVLSDMLRSLTDEQVVAWAKANEYGYLLDEAEGMSIDGMRELMHADLTDPDRMGEGMDVYYSRQLGEIGGSEAGFERLSGYLRSEGITALSYDNNIEDAGSVSYIVPDPVNVRSVNAAFEANTGGMLAQSNDQTTPDPTNLPKRRTALEVWQAMSLEEKRPYHEQFARGFEAYLFEGKAPSQELTGLFARFRSWLISVYKSIKALNVEISPELRGVFDRMIATDEAIKQAEAMRSYAPLFKSAEEMGDAEMWAEYQRTGAEATRDAVDGLQRRSLRDMQWLTNARGRILKQLQADAKAKRKAVEDEVRAEVKATPVYAAMHFLKRGEMGAPDGEQVKVEKGYRLDTAALAEMYPETMLARPALERLQGMTRKDGLQPDLVAEMFGFSSGDQMVREIIAATPEAELIEGMTDQRVLERYGDLANPDTLARAVDEAIHNEARARFVATELKALSKAMTPVRAIAKAAKDFAAATIARKKVRDIKPRQHAAAESRAAKAAEKAMAAGDTTTAAVEKRNQLVQNYSTRLSYEALDEIGKAVKYLRKFDSEGTRKNIDTEYVDQIDQLLERFDLRASVTNKAADKRAKLAAWLESQREQGFEPDIPADLVDSAMRKPYRELTLEELRGLVDTVKQIEHLGRLKQKLLTAKDEREFKAIRDEIAASIEANAKGTRELRTRTTTGAMLTEAGNRFLAMHRKMASVAREMDGYADGGPVWEYFIRSMNAAGDRETTRRADATARLYALVKPLTASGKMGGKGVFFDTLGMSLNREERIAIALNLGNAGNMQRLLDGQGWTMTRLQPVLDTITPEEADFVQAVWDFFESYRPEIGAKERRIYGKEPDWVEPVPIVLGGKTLKGGYYPIKYDPAASGRAEQHADADAAKAQMRGAYTTATTRRSFTKSRAEEVTGRPLLYSLAGLYQGTNEVIHDLSWHEWLIDANRLLRSLDGPIRTHYGPETVGVFKKAIEDIAAGDVPAQNVFERGINHVRTGATIAGLGWNLMTSLLQPVGLTQSMVRIGPGWVAKGMSQWIKAPLDTLTEIKDKSPMMASRAQTMQREINEIQNQVRGSHLDPVRATFFVLIQKMQMVADVPTWLGAYEKAIAEGQAEDRAVALADQAVLDAQGGGQMKDLSQIQRGHPALKLFTNFYSFFNVAYNLGVEKTKQKITQPKLYPSLALDYLLLYVLPAAFVTVMKDAILGGDDDEDKLVQKIIADQISYLLGLMVGLREVTAAVQKVAGVEQFKGSYGGPAGLRLFQEIDKLGQQIGQGEADMALFKAANNAAGIVFHYPSGQVNRSVEGVAALVEGKTQNPMAVVVGPPKP